MRLKFLQVKWMANDPTHGNILIFDGPGGKFEAHIDSFVDVKDYERWYNLICGLRYASDHNQEVIIEVEDSVVSAGKVDPKADFKIIVENRANEFMPEQGIGKEIKRKDTQ